MLGFSAPRPRGKFGHDRVEEVAIPDVFGSLDEVLDVAFHFTEKSVVAWTVIEAGATFEREFAGGRGEG
jgi:hypothetical protein